MVQSADCNIPDSTYSCAAELYGLQGVFILSTRFCKNMISLIDCKSCMTEGINAFIFAVMAKGEKHVSHAKEK